MHGIAQRGASCRGPESLFIALPAELPAAQVPIVFPVPGISRSSLQLPQPPQSPDCKLAYSSVISPAFSCLCLRPPRADVAFLGPSLHHVDASNSIPNLSSALVPWEARADLQNE